VATWQIGYGKKCNQCLSKVECLSHGTCPTQRPKSLVHGIQGRALRHPLPGRDSKACQHCGSSVVIPQLRRHTHSAIASVQTIQEIALERRKNRRGHLEITFPKRIHPPRLARPPPPHQRELPCVLHQVFPGLQAHASPRKGNN
jgi:hypothetical protein